MTNHWIDIRNADVVLVMGSNPAENHPISMKWIMKAKERGGKLVVVDPRFTRTAAKADVYAPMRSGTDIPFLGGMIKYIIDNNLIFREYVVNYTNASFLVNPDFKGPGELDGLFSGYNDKARKYDKKTWSYQAGEDGIPKKDPSLQNPRCVYQLLKKHYSRYTLEQVSDICGTPKDKLEEVYKVYASTGSAIGSAPSSTPWAGPSTPSAPRTSGPCASSNSCSGTWAWPAADQRHARRIERAGLH
jgi:formate dehydrogenase major subunit